MRTQPAIQTLKTTRFQDLTGCNPLEMAKLSNPYNGGQLQTAGQYCFAVPILVDITQTMTMIYLLPIYITHAGCSAEFANAVNVLQAGTCHRGTPEQVAEFPKNYLFYAEGKRGQKQNYCDTDTYLFNLGTNDAVQLRAFLYSSQVCVTWIGVESI